MLFRDAIARSARSLVRSLAQPGHHDAIASMLESSVQVYLVNPDTDSPDNAAYWMVQNITIPLLKAGE